MTDEEEKLAMLAVECGVWCNETVSVWVVLLPSLLQRAAAAAFLCLAFVRSYQGVEERAL